MQKARQSYAEEDRLLGESAAVSNTANIEDATISELQSAMASGSLSAYDLVNYYLTRIEQLDAQLSSLITLNPNAAKVATQLDKKRAAGQLLGSLHGIPLVIKDNIDTADMPTTGGSKALAKSQPPDDAFVVAQLRDAGAIILAKANLHELAQRGETVSSLGGQTCNPYNLDYTPGGSSGGSAAAIAANFAVAGLGTDTINSVRSPASACNLVGLRPTSGLVSRDGLMPVSLTQDVIGPMGRSVADVAMLLSAIAVTDSEDPMTVRSTGHTKGNYETALKKGDLKGKKIGIVPSLFGQDADSEAVNQLMQDAISAIKSLGARCVNVAATIDINGLLAELSLTQWEFKLHFEQYLETIGPLAPVKTLKALLKTGKVHKSIQPQLKAAAAIKTPLGNSAYWQRLYPNRVELRKILNHIFERQQLDALLYPHQRVPAARIGQPQTDRNGFLAAASGFPAITVPAGFTTENIPVGLELMAKPFEEDKLLQMAYAYEQKTQWRKPPSLSVNT